MSMADLSDDDSEACPDFNSHLPDWYALVSDCKKCGASPYGLGFSYDTADNQEGTWRNYEQTEWISECQSCYDVQKLGRTAAFPPKSKGFRGPSFEDVMQDAVGDQDYSCCGHNWGPMREIGGMRAIFKTHTDEQRLQLTENLRKWKSEWRANAFHGPRSVGVGNPDDLYDHRPDPRGVGVDLPTLNKTTRPPYIRALLDGWLGRALLPHVTLSEKHITDAKKIALLLPWFDKKMARTLFRSFAKVGPMLGSHSTEELAIVFASIVSMWMPDEIPVVVEAYFESLLDLELFKYQYFMVMSISWYFENMWNLLLPWTIKMHPCSEYARICMATALHQVASIASKGKELLAGTQDLIDLRLKTMQMCLSMRVLRAPEAIPQMRLAVTEGLWEFMENSFEDNFPQTLEMFDRPVRASDPGVKWFRDQLEAHSVSGSTRSVRERCQSKLAWLDGLIRESSEKEKKLKMELGEDAYAKLDQPYRDACDTLSEKSEKLFYNLAKTGAQFGLRSCAQELVPWFKQYACATCKRVVQVGLSKRCGRCRKVRYCDRNCQKSDWKAHKPHCVVLKVLG
eukprot:154753_1